LTAWEAVEAVALAGQTSVKVRRGQLVFELDMRPSRHAEGGRVPALTGGSASWQHQPAAFEIRNPKPEIRNKFQFPK